MPTAMEVSGSLKMKSLSKMEMLAKTYRSIQFLELVLPAVEFVATPCGMILPPFQGLPRPHGAKVMFVRVFGISPA